MKKILFLSILFSLLLAGHAFAAYTFTSTTKGTEIDASLTGAKGSKSTFELEILTSAFPSGTTPPATFSNSAAIFNTADIDKQPASDGTVTWNIKNYSTITLGTTYYIGVVEIAPNGKRTYAVSQKTLTTAAAPNPLATISLTPLTTTLDGNNIVVSGKVTNALGTIVPSDYTISLVYTATIPTTGATSLSNTFGPLASRTTPKSDGPTGINSDGTYYWYLTSLQPSTVYYFQQKLVYKGDTANAKADTINHFNSSVGTTIAPGSTAEQADLNQRSYTLISKGFPGLTVLPDPDLCAQERAAGQAPKFCDINDVLNYFLKLLIGITGVFLVFRLMIEGYKYMTTDVPWLKVNAKSGFLTALTGLLLALTSYIILNTINPKLVNENISINQLSIGVPGNDGLGTTGISGVAKNGSDLSWLKSNGRKNTLTLKNGGTVTIQPCDTTQMQNVTAFGQTFQIQKNLAASIMRIDAKWKQMNPKYAVKEAGGYTCRTIANSNKISYHAYGMAVDINPDTNAQNSSGNKGDMPASFIKLWTDEGWGWGGNWKSSQDPMHFSKASNEQGDLRGE